MEGADHVEVAASGVAVEGNEHDVSKDSWDNNQPSVGVGTSDGLAIDEEIALAAKMRLAEACSKAGVELRLLEVLFVIVPGLSMKPKIAFVSQSSSYALDHSSGRGRRTPTAPLRNAWTQAAGAAI